MKNASPSATALDPLCEAPHLDLLPLPASRFLASASLPWPPEQIDLLHRQSRSSISTGVGRDKRFLVRVQVPGVSEAYRAESERLESSFLGLKLHRYSDLPSLLYAPDGQLLMRMRKPLLALRPRAEIRAPNNADMGQIEQRSLRPLIQFALRDYNGACQAVITAEQRGRPLYTLCRGSTTIGRFGYDVVPKSHDSEVHVWIDGYPLDVGLDPDPPLDIYRWCTRRRARLEFSAQAPKDLRPLLLCAMLYIDSLWYHHYLVVLDPSPSRLDRRHL